MCERINSREMEISRDLQCVCKGPVALGGFYVYFAKKSVNADARRV